MRFNGGHSREGRQISTESGHVNAANEASLLEYCASRVCFTVYKVWVASIVYVMRYGHAENLDSNRNKGTHTMTLKKQGVYSFRGIFYVYVLCCVKQRSIFLKDRVGKKKILLSTGYLWLQILDRIFGEKYFVGQNVIVRGVKEINGYEGAAWIAAADGLNIDVDVVSAHFFLSRLSVCIQ